MSRGEAISPVTPRLTTKTPCGTIYLVALKNFKFQRNKEAPFRGPGGFSPPRVGPSRASAPHRPRSRGPRWHPPARPPPPCSRGPRFPRTPRRGCPSQRRRSRRGGWFLRPRSPIPPMPQFPPRGEPRARAPAPPRKTGRGCPCRHTRRGGRSRGSVRLRGCGWCCT